MTLKLFNELYLGKAVHCKTEELANEFLELTDSFGYKWWLDYKLTHFNRWEMFQHKTCYIICEDKYLLLSNIDGTRFPIVEFKGGNKNENKT